MLLCFSVAMLLLLPMFLLALLHQPAAPASIPGLLLIKYLTTTIKHNNDFIKLPGAGSAHPASFGFIPGLVNQKLEEVQ